MVRFCCSLWRFLRLRFDAGQVSRELARFVGASLILAYSSRIRAASQWLRISAGICERGLDKRNPLRAARSFLPHCPGILGLCCTGFNWAAFIFTAIFSLVSLSCSFCFGERFFVRLFPSYPSRVVPEPWANYSWSFWVGVVFRFHHWKAARTLLRRFCI